MTAMGTTVYWAVLCLAIAAVLFAVEIFIPSGGLLGLLSAAALVTGVVLLFQVNTALGMAGAIASLVAVPVAVLLAMKLWPHTPIFRMLVLDDAQQRSDSDAPADAREPGALVGHTGTAVTDLRPSGMCVIDGKRLDCLSDHGLIESGTAVRVVRVDGRNILVRAES